MHKPTPMDRDSFVLLLNNELGLTLSTTDLDTQVDQLSQWDSVHLLRLLIVLEERLERRLGVAQLLEIRTLGQLYEKVNDRA
jgi:acyl carrier protein